MTRKSKPLSLSPEEARLVRIVLDKPGIVRADLADILDLSQASLAGIIKRLFENGVLEEAGKASSQGGRRASQLAISPQLALIHLKGTVELEAVSLAFDASLIATSEKHETLLGEISQESQRAWAEAVAETIPNSIGPALILDVSNGITGFFRSQSGSVIIHEWPESAFTGEFQLDSITAAKNLIEPAIQNQIDSKLSPGEKVGIAADMGCPNSMEFRDTFSERFGEIAADFAQMLRPVVLVFTTSPIWTTVFDWSRTKNSFQKNTRFDIAQNIALERFEIGTVERFRGLARIALREHLLKLENLNDSNLQR